MASGAGVTLEVWPQIPHSWRCLAERLPEGREAIARIGGWLNERVAAD